MPEIYWVDFSGRVITEYEILNREIADGIAVVTVCRPKALNALNTRFFQEMNNLIKEFDTDDSVECVIITAEGKAFVAGADIAEIADKTQKQGAEFPG